MKKNWVIWLGGLLFFTLGFLALFWYFAFYSKLTWKDVKGKDGIVNDYGLMEFYYKGQEIPANCNLIGSSNESCTVDGITLKLVSYMFDGYLVHAVFEASGENMMEVAKFHINNSSDMKGKYQLASASCDLGKVNREKMILGKKYFFYSCNYQAGEEKIICFAKEWNFEQSNVFHLQETMDKVSCRGEGYKVEMSPAGLYIYGESSPCNLTYIQKDGKEKVIIENWELEDEDSIRRKHEFSEDEVVGSYYEFAKLIRVKDKKLVSD